jgi:anaerobic selenocysteine-containing dehydrogenase
MCGLRVEVEGDTITSVRGDPDDPLSKGAICPKAAALIDLHADPDRLRYPVKRTERGFERVGWDEALDEIAARVLKLQAEHGRNSVGLYLGNPTVHNLGLMVMGPTLWRTLGSRNRYSATSVDQLPHQLVASLMFGHQLLIPIPDIDRTELFVVLGANPLVSNGSLMSAPGMRKRLDALEERGGKLVVFDPRKTETAERADEHHFVRPGTDAALLAAMVHTVLEERGARTATLPIEGLEALRSAVTPFVPERVAAYTGVPADVIRRVALAMHDVDRAVLYVRFGACTQRFGALTVWMASALNVVTGHLDRPGGAMFTEPALDPIRPRLGRGVGPGSFGRFRARVSGRKEFAGELPVAGLADEILTPGPEQMKGLLVWAGNPVLSTPNGQKLDQAMASLELCVAVDYTINETSRHAHFVLPPVAPLAREHYDIAFHVLAVRNTSRWSDPAVAPDGELLQDWQIALGLVERLSAGRGKGRTLRTWLQHRAMRALGPKGMVDLALRTGPRRLSVGKLRASPSGVDLGPLRPCLTARMKPGRSVRLAPEELLADLPRLLASMEEPVAPLVLIGRRQLQSCNSWLHNSRRLTKGKPRCTLLVHPEDAEAAGLVSGGWVEVRSRSGSVRVQAEVTPDILQGVVSLPHGWGHDRSGVKLSVASSVPGASVNDLTDETLVDELSGNAALSGVPVELRAVPPEEFAAPGGAK